MGFVVVVLWLWVLRFWFCVAAVAGVAAVAAVAAVGFTGLSSDVFTQLFPPLR